MIPERTISATYAAELRPKAMKDNNVILEVKDLHKSFGEQEVLKGISTEVNRGDVIAIIGPSGCGKSTFLRSLNLLETPTSGQILFEGTDLTDKSTDINVTRQKIGMVFQQFNLFANMTIKANIMLAPVKLGVMTKDEASKKADELLTRIGLLDKADAYPAQLSGGQKQRVAIIFHCFSVSSQVCLLRGLKASL
jgi:polar amino acid transport system ATP-binding protein